MTTLEEKIKTLRGIVDELSEFVYNNEDKFLQEFAKSYENPEDLTRVCFHDNCVCFSYTGYNGYNKDVLITYEEFMEWYTEVGREYSIITERCCGN